MAALSTRVDSASVPIEQEKFVVPYKRNPHFVGREKLLIALKDKLVEEAVQKYNYQIFLAWDRRN